MKTFVSSDRSTGSIAFKMIEAKNSRVFEVYEGSNAIEIDSDGSIYIVARGKAKMKGLFKKFAHKQVANVLVSKIRANLERTRDAIAGGANTARNNNNGDAALFA
jgi:acylphosphatase